MSVEAALAFLKKIETDDALRAKLAAADGRAAQAVELGKEMGLDFSVQDLQDAQDELDGELSDEDLADAAGGLGSKQMVIRFD